MNTNSTIPEAGRNREGQPPAQNPCSDVALLRIPYNPPDTAITAVRETVLYASREVVRHRRGEETPSFFDSSMPGPATSFYLRYLPGIAGEPLIRPLADRYDAAAFIIGKAGRSVDVTGRGQGPGTNMPDRKGDPMPAPPEPGQVPAPATDIPLFRSARYSLYTSGPVESGTDIYVRIKRDGTHRFFLRDWSEQHDTCTSVSEEFAVRLLRGLAAMPETAMYIESENIRRFLPGYFKNK